MDLLALMGAASFFVSFFGTKQKRYSEQQD
jgi:hypothetical protein